MRDRIKDLENRSRALEPDAHQRKVLRDAVINYTERFLDNIDDTVKCPAYQSGNSGEDILQHPIGEDPIDPEQAYDLIRSNVDQEGLNPASGGDMGYIPGGGVYTSSLGDYWADITNQYAGIFFASPGAVRMENHLLNWMSVMIGYPTTALGNLTSGGSIANLVGIVAARDAHHISSTTVHRSVIYLSQHAHHCIDKAVHIAGLRECQIRFIEVDENYRISIEHLRGTLEHDLQKGLSPWLLIGSAGTTNTGAVDPLEAMADIADEYNLWFHVDAAYGGFFMLTPYGKQKLKGIERSHSVVIDPHKGLFLPYGTGVVLVREGQLLQKSFSYEAGYMQDAVHNTGEISPAEISPELTKHFRGLRMWLPLMIHGLKPFRAALDEKLLLTRYIYDHVQKMENVEIGPEPDLSVFTFRFVPGESGAEKFNRDVLAAIHKDGKIFISSTTIDGVFLLRFAILSFRTHLKEVDLALEVLKEKYEDVLKQEAIR